jgi:hypothetical protein
MDIGQLVEFLIFAFIVPLAVQLVKVIADRYGKSVADYVCQGISFLLGVGLLAATGGFLGLTLPVFPPFTGDAFGFVGALLTYAGQWLALAIVILGAVEIPYRKILKAILERAGFATKAAIAKRRALEA